MNLASDSQLQDQLQAAEKSQSTVQAWFQLRSDRPGELTPSPERTKALADDLVQRATYDSGENPENVQVLDQLGSFQVQAKPEFLRVLSRQPEVLTARTTNLPGLELIRPVKTEPVKFTEGRKKHTSRKESARTRSSREL
ncbi:MAG TPA: hypothetical protein VFA99_15470 [Acidobacteriaceae bacterium]|nr:hypothetical protein [Acidobacteriaceae bacterium]